MRTIQRQIAAGKLESREVPGVGGNGLVFEVYIKKNKEINENTNDIKTPKKNKTITENISDISGPATPTSDILTSDSVVGQLSSLDNKDLSPTSDRPATSTVAHSKTVKTNKHKDLVPTSDMRQCTDALIAHSVVGIGNPLKNNEVRFFITTETTVALTNWHRASIFRKINSNEITSIKQPKDGGGFRTMIDVRTLPIEAQEKWKQLVIHENPDTGLSSLSENQRRYAFAMESAMLLWLRYRDDAKKNYLRKRDSDNRFETDIKEGIILTSEVNILGGVSVKTLYRHHNKWETSGRRTSVLAPDRKGNRGRKPIRSDVFYALANTWILTQPATRAAHLYSQLSDAILAKQPKTTLPSYPTFLKYYKKVKERQALVIAGKQGKKTLDNIMPYVPRNNDALPGDVWQYDGYVMKMLVHNPWLKDSLIRPVVVYFYDVSTDLVTGWAISYSERSDVIASAWQHAMTRFPAPRILQPDNPVGIYNEQLCAKHIVEFETRKKHIKLKQRAVELTMTGRNGIFFDCGLERIKFVTPGNSKGKKIEPAHFRIFRPLETQPRFADVYVGMSPDDRPEHLNRTNKAILKDKKLNIPEWDFMVEEIGKHIEYYNNRKKKLLQNFSPQEAYLQMTDMTKKLTADELKYKALWTEERSCRNGYIKLFDDILYQHAAFTVMKKVKIGYNVNDLSKLRVFGDDGRELSTPALMVQKGSYTQDEISAEAIKANRTFRKKAISLQKELLITDIKKLNNRELHKLLNSDIDQDKKELIQVRLNEIEKYPEFGKLTGKDAKTQRDPIVERIIKEEPIPDLSHIIDAKFEVEETKDTKWLDAIINKEETQEDAPIIEKPKNDKINKTLNRLGI